MKISYLITVSTETNSLKNLLVRVISCKDKHDEIIILVDRDVKDNIETESILSNFARSTQLEIDNKTVAIHKHSLNKNYSEHKNFGATLCSGDFIFQIDGDELPTETLLLNIKDIIAANPNVEVFWIPRLNDFKGVTEDHAKQWGWRLSPSDSIVHEKIINTESDEYKFLKNNGYILEEIKI